MRSKSTSGCCRRLQSCSSSSSCCWCLWRPFVAAIIAEETRGLWRRVAMRAKSTSGCCRHCGYACASRCLGVCHWSSRRHWIWNASASATRCLRCCKGCRSSRYRLPAGSTRRSWCKTRCSWCEMSSCSRSSRWEAPVCRTRRGRRKVPSGRNRCRRRRTSWRSSSWLLPVILCVLFLPSLRIPAQP